MDKRQLSAFISVFEERNITRAAEQLSLTQPALSATVKALEEELGVAILVRERRKAITLTVAGVRIVSHLRRLMSEVSAVKEIAEQEKQNPIRTLHIGCFPSACACILPGIIHHFEQHHPHIKIIPYEENSTAIVDSLRSGDIDAGFVHFPVNGMYCVPVYRDKFTVVVPESHPLAANSTISVEQLVGEPLIISKGRYELSIMALFKEKGIEPVIKYEFNHPDTAMSFIRQGLGIALLPELTLKAVGGKVRSVALEPTFYRQISLLAKEPPVDGSPLFLLQACMETLTADGLI